MGNICPWCFKKADNSQSNGNLAENSERRNSQSEVNDRTPLIGKPGNHTQHHHPERTGIIDPRLNGEPISLLAPLLPPPVSDEYNPESTTIPLNETAETKMAFIVEGMLSKLIDVGNGSSGVHQTNPTTNGLNTQNDYLKQILSKSLSSTKISNLPDAGLANLPSLLSGRPISSDICHFVAHTAGELSRLLIDEIKIIHKEDLVVIFE